MAKILITGANGFIGSALTNKLEEQGNTIVKLKHDRLRDAVSLEIVENMVDVDYIYNLAAYGNMYDQKDEFEILQANVANLWNLLQATKKLSYKCFVNVSTSSVNLPYQTFYAATKKAGEDICKAFISEYQKPIVIVRPYSVYGIGEASHRFIPKVFHSCMTGSGMELSPKSTHDWVYIDDFVDFLIGISKTSGMTEMPSLYEFGSGISTTNEEVVSLIEEITGKKANIIERKALRSWDNGEWCAKQKQAKTTLWEGLTKYYEWYQKQRS